MFGPPRAQNPYIRWGHHRPPHNPQWRHPVGPRAPFHGQHQRYNHPRPPFQSGNDNYWCETCDRGFPTEDILTKHNQQHQKCNIDGCQFIAHPKVITKHIQMQHSTGLYKKIANIKNPEEIEKWREERRKRYPTKATIENKAAKLKEKIDRGEKMGLEREKKHRYKPNSEHDQRPGQGVKRNFNARHENQPRAKVRRNNPTENKHNKNPPSKAKPKPTHDIAEDSKLKPFTGILSLQMDCDGDGEVENDCVEHNGLFADEDDYVEFKSENVEKIIENLEPVVCGALSSLMCDYGSSEEEDMNERVTTNSKSLTQSSEEIQNNNSNLIQQPNQVPEPVSSRSYSLVTPKHTTVKCDAEPNKDSVKLQKTVCNQLTSVEDTVIRHKAGINEKSTNLVHNSDQGNDDRSSGLKEKTGTKVITITSTPIDIDRILNNDSNNSEPEKNKTNISKTTFASEANGIIKNKEIKKDQQTNNVVQQSIHNEGDSDSGPEEMKADVKKEDTTFLEEPKPIDVRKKVIKGRMQSTINQRRRPKLPSTLLQKLLHKEVQQERNIILQCIRYVRNNNYFDKKE